ncbi:MAG TPA: hypothetical protein VFS43_42305 [Polyangiaceae bacterium]|nr:hypothetical protein [Polyangiaceae bacterium]
MSGPTTRQAPAGARGSAAGVRGLAAAVAMASAGACGAGATVEVAENGAPPSRAETDATGALVVHDCGPTTSSKVSTYAGTSSGTELLLLGIYSSYEGRAVVLDTRAAPHVLAVSSFQATRWVVETGAGSGLERVIVNGYDEQAIEVPPGVEVTNLSGEASLGMYGFVWPPAQGGEETSRLVGAVQALAGVRLSAFAGCQEASSFSVVDGPAGDRGCAGASGFGRYAAALCPTQLAQVITPDILCEDALAQCRRLAGDNPDRGVTCTWNDRTIFQLEKNPGDCAGVVPFHACAGAEGAAPFVATHCASGALVDGDDGQLSCDDAYRRCVRATATSLDGPVACTWGDRRFFAPEVDAADCPN